MANENRRKLYDALNGAGYDIGSYDDFDSRMNNAADRQKFYNAVSAEYDIGSREDFEKRIKDSKYKLTIGGRVTPVSERQYKDYMRRHPSQPAAGGAGAPGAKPAGGVVTPAGFGELNVKEAALSPFQRQQLKQAREDRVKEAFSNGKAPGAGAKKPESYGAQVDDILRDDARQPNTIDQVGEAMNGDAEAMEAVGMGRAAQQMKDRADYYAATGKELENLSPVFDELGYAPTVARDEYGNMMYEDGDEPLTGISNDRVRGNAQAVLHEEARQADLQRQMDEANSELEEIRKKMSALEAPDYVFMQDAASPYADPRATNSDMAVLSAAYSKVKERIKQLEVEKAGGQQGFFNGLLTTAADPSTWLLGMDKLQDNVEMLRVAEKMKSGGELTDNEKSMLEATLKQQQVEGRLAENSDFLYRAGAMTAQMVPFMLQIALTDGFGGVAAVGEGAGKELAAKYAQKFGQDALMHRVNANIIKGVGITLGDVAAGFVSANTTGIANTANDALERRMGQLGLNEEGEYEFEGGEDWWRAIGKAEVSQTKEFATERFGEHIPGLKKMGEWFASKGAGARKIVRGLEGLAGTEAMQKTAAFLRKGGMNGVVGEILEEEIGLPVDVAIGDMSWEDALSGKTQWDICGGMLLSMGAMHAVGAGAQGIGKTYDTAQYYRYKRRVDKAGRAADFRIGDRWTPLREEIDGTKTEDMDALWDRVRDDESMQPEEKRAVYNYINALTLERGYNMGMFFSAHEAARRPEPAVNLPAKTEEDDVKAGVMGSRDAGYNITDPQAMNDAKTAYEVARAEAEKVLGEWTLKALDGNQTLPDGTAMDPMDIVAHMSKEYDDISETTDEQRQAAVAYLNAKAAYEGMLERVRDDIDAQIEQSDATVDGRVNRQTNRIQPVTLNNGGRQVHVIDGRIALLNDGAIDFENSTESLLVRDAQTGELMWTSPHEVLSVDAAIDPEEEKEAARQTIRETYAQEQANIIDGVLAFQAGDVYGIVDEQGKQHQVTIVQDNGDGTVMASYDGGKAELTQKDMLQQMSDNANRARVAQQMAMPAGNAAGTVADDEGYDYEAAGGVETPVDNSEIVAAQEAARAAAEGAGAPDVDVPDVAAYDYEAAGGVETPVDNSEIVAAQADAADRGAEGDYKPMPMTQDGEPDFDAVKPVRAYQYIYDESGLDADDANAFVDNKVAEAQKQVEKIGKKRPKIGTSIARFKKKMEAWEADAAQAQAAADYWNQVKSERDMFKEEPAGEAAGTVAEAVTADDMAGLEGTMEAVIAQNMPKITPESYRKETGLSNADKGDPFFVASKAKGGMTVDEAVVSLRELFEGQNVDEDDIRNAVIDIISGGGPRSYLKRLREEVSRMRADEERYEAQMRDEWAREHFGHLGVESYEQWQEMEDAEVERLRNKYAGVDAQGLAEAFAEVRDAELAERELQDEAFGQRLGAADVLPPTDINLNDNDNGRENEEASGAEGGTGVLQKEQPIPAGRGGESKDRGAADGAGTEGEGAHGRTQKKTGNVEGAGNAAGEPLRAFEDGKMSADEVLDRFGITDEDMRIKGRTILDEYDDMVGDAKDPEQFKNDAAGKLEKLAEGKDVTTFAEDIEAEDTQAAIAAAEAETAPHPTEAQKEAGNYRKGHVRIDGLDISIENPKGSVRSGRDADGNEWSVTMNNTYGYIRGTEGVDGDHIDVFLGDGAEIGTGNVYVVDQVNADGSFDEHKVMYGFGSAEEARAAYLANYSPGWHGLGVITEVSKDEFRKWIDSSHRKTKPFAEYKSVKSAGAQNEGSGHTAANGAGGVLSLNGEEYAISDIEETVRGHVQEVIDEGGFDAEIVGVRVIGSYVRGEQRDDSDLDVLVEYKGKAKEDALFDALVDAGLEINGVTVDVNPITRGKSGTIEQFLERNAGFSKVGGADAQGVGTPAVQDVDKESGTHSDAYNSVVELADAYSAEVNEHEDDDTWEDTYNDYDKRAHDLAATLSDEELKELYDELANNYEDLEMWVVDILEGRESIAERKRVEEQAEANKEAISKVRKELDALVAAVKGGDKKAIKKAKEALTSALLKHGVGHKFMCDQIYALKRTKRTDADYARNKAAVDAMKKAVEEIEKALSDALADAGLDGVSLSYEKDFAFWLSAKKGSKYYDAIESLDNNERWLTEINGQTGGLASELPQLNMENVDEYVQRVKEVISSREEHDTDDSNEETKEQDANGSGEKDVKSLNDEQLLAAMEGNSHQDSDNVTEEYDARHQDEYNSEVDRYAGMLADGVSQEEAEDMLADVSRQWRDGGFRTSDRTKLMAQMEAIDAYLQEKAEGQRSVDDKRNDLINEYADSYDTEMTDILPYLTDEEVQTLHDAVGVRNEADEQENEEGFSAAVKEKADIEKRLKDKYADKVEEGRKRRRQREAEEKRKDLLQQLAGIDRSKPYGTQQYEAYRIGRMYGLTYDNVEEALSSVSADDMRSTTHILPFLDGVADGVMIGTGKAKQEDTRADAYNSQFGKSLEDMEAERKAKKGTDAKNEGSGRTAANGKAVAPKSAQGAGKIDDVGEKILGARKDMQKTIVQSIENATVQSLIELPFSKAFKKPNLAKAVEAGALREKDAIFYEAWFAGSINSQKPKITQRESRNKRWNPSYKTNVERWAESTHKNLQFLKEFIEADDERRDAIMAEALSVEYPSIEREKADLARMKELNPDDGTRRHEWGEKWSPNPISVIYEVMQRLGYKVGGKLELPFGIVKPNVSFTAYHLANVKGETEHVSVASVEEAVDRIVWLAKLKRGDTDIQHPASSFVTVPTKTEYRETGKYSVRWGSWNKVQERQFDTKEEADAFAKEKESRYNSTAYVSPVQEVARRHGYKIQFRHPLTGERHVVSAEEFDTKEEALAYLDGNFDAINDATNAQLGKESKTRNEVTADDMLQVSLTSADGRNWKYAVSIRAEYANNFGMPLALKEGFESREAAKKYAEGIKDEVFRIYNEYKSQRKAFVFFDTGENSRAGEDYRGGRDVTGEDFMNTFGFRGVQFGNWTNQADRQMAVNQAYDAFMDLAKLIGISPRALSLNGELGIAFGARGSGNALAHYEPSEVVINLTKTRGAGSLAHEWWHALDNYLARTAGLPAGMVTDSNNIAMRGELRSAFNALTDQIRGSEYYKRSRMKGDYWGRMHEVTARLLAEWVDQSLKKKGELNTFLSRGADIKKFVDMNYRRYTSLPLGEGEKRMTREEFEDSPMALDGSPYPSAKEVEEFGDAMRRIFETIEEREENGRTVLFQIASGELHTEANTEAQRLATEALLTALDENAGIEVIMETQETGLRVAAGQDAEMMAVDRSTDEYKKKVSDATVQINNRLEELNRSEVEAQSWHTQNENPVSSLDHDGQPSPSNEGDKGAEASDAKLNKNLHPSNILTQKTATFVNNLTKNNSITAENFGKKLVEALEIADSRSISQYIHFTSDDGGKITLRISDHSGNARNIIINGVRTDKGYSIVLRTDESPSTRFKANKWSDVNEYVYDNPDKTRLVNVAKSIFGLFDQGEYIDIANADEHNISPKETNAESKDGDLKNKSRVEFMERPNGTVYGWSEGNRIHLTPEGLNPNTPIHEYTHLWAKALMQNNPKLWGSIKEMLKDSPIWNEVLNDPAYQGLRGDEDAVASEALSRLSGRNGAKKMEQMAQRLLDEAKDQGVFALANAHSLIARVRKALSDFWKWVGTNLFDITEFKDVDEVTDRVLWDMLSGTDLQLDEAEHGDRTEFSRVTEANATAKDKEIMQEIADGKTETVYRGMQQVEIDGKQYALPPMASKINGEWVLGIEIREDGTLEPMLLKADEHPELANDKGKFYLDKGNDKGLWAAYNPYWHVGKGMLNDQFAEAQDRANLITVEGVIPTSELTDGYHADKAKDGVGAHEWKAGIIQGQLSGTREVILSRYFQGVRVVPNDEVARNIFEQINGKVDVMPSNVVPPGVRTELEKLGVEFIETNNKNELLEGEHKGDRYTWWYGKNAVKNRAKKFKELAKEAGMKLSDWMKENGREGQLPDAVVQKADARFKAKKGAGARAASQKSAQDAVLTRMATEFEDGEVLPIEYDAELGGYKVRGLNAVYHSRAALMDAFREKYSEYAAIATDEGDGIEVTSWRSVFAQPAGNAAGTRPKRRARGRGAAGTRREAAAADRKKEASLAEHVARKTRNAIKAIEEQARRLGLDVEVRTDTEGLTGRRARAKGWYDTKTGKIVIILPNHSNGGDVMRTLLHEGVAHHGLRELFGKDFDTFIDNVFANADESIRREIVELSKKYGWDMRVATEEYLAGLAEDTNFERAMSQGWWVKIKNLLLDMLRKAGLHLGTSLSDADLRYILWRSYENLKENGQRGILGMAEDVVMQEKLGVGNFRADEPGGSATGNETAGRDAALSAGSDAALAADSVDGLRYRDGGDEGERPLSLQESIIQGLMTLAERNRDNVQFKVDVVRSIGGKLSQLRKAMSAQRAYDRSTVNDIVGLARLMMNNGYLSDMRGSEVKKLLTIIKNATGKEDTSKAARELVDMLVDNQVRQAMQLLATVMKIKANKVNAQGVEVQGELDPRGQALVKAFHTAMSMTEEQIVERLAEVSDRMDNEDQAIADNAATEYTALNLALMYAQDVLGSRAEEKALRQQIADAKEEHKAGQMDDAAYKQFVQSIEDAIMQNKLERIEAVHELTAKLAGLLRGSVEAAEAFREREKQRVNDIHHYANSDMQGRPSDEHHQEDWKQKVMNNSFIRFFLKPLATFDQMLRMFGNKSVNGEGYLYNHYMRGWLEANDKEFKKFHAACEELDRKVSEVFGKKMRWSDLYSVERKLPKYNVSFWDGGGMRYHELTQGNLLYIYMANKMSDGKMKLRRMGITEEDMEYITDAIDPRFIELADWLQGEFLVNKRNDYNEVHVRMFGAPMAAIDNYFPLKILSNARVEEVDVADERNDKTLPSTTTGSIIKRRRNALALDVTGADAFSVVIEHLQQMEKWAAFAEFNRDVNTLLSYKRFRNQVQNMSSIYGAGKTLWNNFKDCARIAAGTYHPAVGNDSVDKTLVNVAKGVTSAKIAFRIFTALKQMLSFPAYFAEASAKNLAVSVATSWKSWNWAMKELPTFAKRWQSKQAGDSRLLQTDMDWRFWRNKAVETLGRWGMSPNAFVDAVTVAIGARAIYKTKLAEYRKKGYDEEAAEKRAKQDAAVLVNETQQSNENAFLSAMQLDRSVASVALSVFRNSSMGYQRQLVDALRTLGRMMKPGYRSQSIAFMQKQMVRDGLSEEQAERAAKRTYGRAVMRNLVRTAIFGYVMQLAWNLGPNMLYLLVGGDDDDKWKMLEDAAIHALFGGLEGLSGGNVMSELLNMKASGQSVKNYDFNLLPLMSDVQHIMNSFETDKVAAANDIVNLLAQSAVGVNPQTLTDAAVAIWDACGDDARTSREATILIARLLSMPQSQIEKIYIDELRMSGEDASKLSVQEMAERYAKYKKKRGAALMQWAYSDDEEKAIEDKYIQRFEKKAREEFGSTGDKALDEAYAAYGENYKEVGKMLREASALKNGDVMEYARRVNEIASLPRYVDYSIYSKYKKHIDDQFAKAMRAQTAEGREAHLDTVADLKRRAVEEIDRRKR